MSAPKYTYHKYKLAKKGEDMDQETFDELQRVRNAALKKSMEMADPDEKRSILEMLHEQGDCAIKEPQYIELTPAVIKCLKRGLNCWTEQNYAGGSEIRKILDKAEETRLRIAEDV